MKDFIRGFVKRVVWGEDELLPEGSDCMSWWLER